jgi:hypothetical protein
VVVVAVLHFLQVYRKVSPRYASVIVELVFGMTPKAFDAVNVVVIPTHQGFGMVDLKVLAELMRGIIAFEGVGVKHRTLSGFSPDNL